MKETLADRLKRLSVSEKLIGANLAVFVLLLVTNVTGFLFSFDLNGKLIPWLALPSDLLTLATRPWTLVTYMFLHEQFFHLLMNLLVLYWFGQLFLQLMGERNLVALYLMGGLAGGLTYVLAYNLFPAFAGVVHASNNRGASAAVMAILLAVATRVPNMSVRLFFVLEVKLWVVALILVLLDLATLPTENAGGHLAHLGGALYGYFYMRAYEKNRNWHNFLFTWGNRLSGLFKPKPKLRKVHSTTSDEDFNGRKKSDQQRLDRILDKIAVSGYDSLSKEEKEFLFKVGKS